jgi:hypothetical protein
MKFIGDLKSLRLLWTNLAITSYCDMVMCEDIITFNHRARNEGITFLTVVLPTLGKALDNYHSTGEWVSPPDFAVGKAGPYPIFMGYAIEKAVKGDSAAVDCVRQMSYIFYKLKVTHDQKTEEEFLDRFVKTDSELLVPVSEAPGQEATLELMGEMRRIIGRILCNTDPQDIRPCHGGGATACHTLNSDKYHKLRYYTKLDETFSYPEFFFFSATHLLDEMQKLEESHVSVPMARVCLVPKDSRGPRIISCEPAELLFIQQGLMRLLYQRLETHPMTAGQLNFTDQSINRALAKHASVSNTHATIDLADASDRVSLYLVRSVFPERWVEALEACRSESTTLPDGRVVKLNKFAPMGSSCCFPVEALVFWACAQATIRIRHGHSGSPVYVYGDDIICQSIFYDDICAGLESIGLLVNRSKSFSNGPFRESCGGDYHLGVDVTPVRIRKPIGHHSSDLAANADLCNNLIAKFGYTNAASMIDIIESAQGYVFPRSERGLPVTVKAEYRASNDVFFNRRWSKDFHRWEHRVLTLTSDHKKSHPPNWGELLRKELSRGVADSGKYTNPLAIMDSVLDPGYYTVPHSVHLKWAWVDLGYDPTRAVRRRG